ncbi:MAG TPA: TspO/MBR family protein [Rhizomicrobium sp.]|jgi:tryptophan-rich sensory protein
MARKDILGLLAFFAACLGLGVVRAIAASHNAANWFATVHRPDFTLPVGMIAPFWTLLYLMIAFSGWIIWRERGFSAVRPLLAYTVQLALNLVTALLFFDANRIGTILVCVVLLTLAVMWNIWEFWRVERIAAILLVPYLVWMGFVVALSSAIWQLNSG